MVLFSQVFKEVDKKNMQYIFDKCTSENISILVFLGVRCELFYASNFLLKIIRREMRDEPIAATFLHAKHACGAQSLLRPKTWVHSKHYRMTFQENFTF